MARWIKELFKNKPNQKKLDFLDAKSKIKEELSKEDTNIRVCLAYSEIMTIASNTKKCFL